MALAIYLICFTTPEYRLYYRLRRHTWLRVAIMARSVKRHNFRFPYPARQLAELVV
jgi:hypothetical protein